MPYTYSWNALKGEERNLLQIGTYTLNWGLEKNVWQAAFRFCLPWASLSLLLYYLVSRSLGLALAHHVRERKGYLPVGQIYQYLSWTTEQHFFQTLTFDEEHLMKQSFHASSICWVSEDGKQNLFKTQEDRNRLKHKGVGCGVEIQNNFSFSLWLLLHACFTQVPKG